MIVMAAKHYLPLDSLLFDLTITVQSTYAKMNFFLIGIHRELKASPESKTQSLILKDRARGVIRRRWLREDVTPCHDPSLVGMTCLLRLQRQGSRHLLPLSSLDLESSENAGFALL